MKKQNRTIIKFILLGAILLVPVFAKAAGLVPCGNEGEAACTFKDIFYMVARVTNYLIAIAGLYAVFKIIQTGFNFITTMGNEEAIAKNKKALSSAVVGMMLVMMAFLFVNTVVNFLLHSKCKIDLTNPLTYLTITDYNTCQ